MKEKSGVAKATKAWKQPLPKAILYPWKCMVYTDPAEMVAAGDQMSLKEQMTARNADTVNKARTAAREDKFKELGMVQPTAENTPRLAWEQMVDSILLAKTPDGKQKFTREQAEAQATMIHGYDPKTAVEESEDDDEESEDDTATA
jgi:hypothetical protein